MLKWTNCLIVVMPDTPQKTLKYKFPPISLAEVNWKRRLTRMQPLSFAPNILLLVLLIASAKGPKVRQFLSILLRDQTYCLSVTTVQLHEIQYSKVKGVPSTSAKTKKKMVRGPYKRDERVVQDEDLLLKLRNYTGCVNEFKYERGEDQQQLLEKFKKGENIVL